LIEWLKIEPGRFDDIGGTMAIEPGAIGGKAGVPM
jgi:hypothetical protein